MKIFIDIPSESVTYEDIGATRRRVFRPKRRMGPRRKRVQKRDRVSVLRREVTNLRAKVKSRLDKVRDRSGTPAEIQKARQESRTFYRDYVRAKQRLDQMTARKKS